MTKKEIANIIDNPIFENLDKEDLLASEMNYLRARYVKNNELSADGLISIIYAAYKLGFAKAYLAMGKELPGTEKKGK